MIQKESFLESSDKTGVFWLKVFHTYKGSHRRVAFVGNFIKTSVQTVKPESFIKRKTKSIALLTRAIFPSTKNDGSMVFFQSNSCILIKRKLVFRSKDFVDPADFKIRRKKLFFKFPGIL